MFEQGFRDQEREEIEEPISPAKCLFGVVCIITMAVVMGVAVIVLLSEGGYNWNY